MSEAETYAALRNFADSWGLVAMALCFLVVCAWPFRPGGRRAADSAAVMIFEEDDHVQ
jgi:cytochrome c oxidase cbb3-type subunit 4